MDPRLVKRFLAMERSDHEAAIERLRSSGDPFSDADELAAAEEAWLIRQSHTGSGETSDHEEEGDTDFLPHHKRPPGNGQLKIDL